MADEESIELQTINNNLQNNEVRIIREKTERSKYTKFLIRITIVVLLGGLCLVILLIFLSIGNYYRNKWEYSLCETHTDCTNYKKKWLDKNKLNIKNTMLNIIRIKPIYTEDGTKHIFRTSILWYTFLIIYLVFILKIIRKKLCSFIISLF